MFGSLGSRTGKHPRYRGDKTISVRRAIAENIARLRPGTIRVTLDEELPDNAAELDGSTITGGAIDNPECAARYPWMVVGNDLVLPDARGRFWRCHDDGAGIDPDAASRTARAGDSQTGDYPGTQQPSEFQLHSHTMRAKDGINMWDAGAVARPSNASKNSLNTGGNETRPPNTNFCCWMVLG